MATENDLKINTVQLWEVREGKPTVIKVFGYPIAIRDSILAELDVNIEDLFKTVVQVIDIEKTKVANNFKSVKSQTKIEQTGEQEGTEEDKSNPIASELEESQAIIATPNDIHFNQYRSQSSIDSKGWTEPPNSQKIQEKEEPFGYHNRKPVYLSKVLDLYTRFPNGFTSIQANDMFIKDYPKIREESAKNKCRAYIQFLVKNKYLEITQEYSNITRLSKYKWIRIPPEANSSVHLKINSDYLKAQRSLGLEKLRSEA